MSSERPDWKNHASEKHDDRRHSVRASGVAVLDPHGEFAEKLLDYVPEERINDVIYFDPSDMEHPIAFNPMEQVGTEFRHLVASGIMGVFKKIWPDAWSARMEYILNNTLLALLEFPGYDVDGRDEACSPTRNIESRSSRT